MWNALRRTRSLQALGSGPHTWSRLLNKLIGDIEFRLANDPQASGELEGSYHTSASATNPRATIASAARPAAASDRADASWICKHPFFAAPVPIYSESSIYFLLDRSLFEACSISSVQYEELTSFLCPLARQF